MANKSDIELGCGIGEDLPSELEAEDKQRTAIYEAGELVVAALLGGVVHAHIESTGSSDRLGDGVWEGSCDVAMGRVDVAAKRLQVAIAGEAAVCLHEHPEADCQRMLELLVLSEQQQPGARSSAVGASLRDQSAAVENVVRLLREFRPAVEWAAQQMISGALVVAECEGPGAKGAFHIRSEQYVLGSVSDSGVLRRLKLTAEWAEPPTS